MINDFKTTTTITKPRIKLLVCYGVWQEAYRNFNHPCIEIIFHEGFDYEYENVKPDIMILDDLMSEIANDKSLTAVFTKTSHHLGISVVFITQNVFHQSKEMRTISLNSHYMIIMKSPRDKMQIMTLGKQIYPRKTRYFMDAYETAVAEPYGHLMIDMTSSSPDEVRLRQRKTIKGVSGFEIYTETNYSSK